MFESMQNTLPKGKIMSFRMRLYVLLVLSATLWVSCSSDSTEEKTLIGRSVSGVRVQLDSLGDYKLSWNPPADLEYFEGYHFWLTNDEAYLGFDLRSEVSGDDFVSAEGQAYYSDSLGNPKLNSWMIPSDKLNLLASDSLFVFVWAEFSAGNKAGARMGTPFFKGDIFPPRDVDLEFSLDTDSIVVSWLHSGDRENLLDTADMNGVVKGYQFYIEAVSLDGVSLSSDNQKINLLDSSLWNGEKPFNLDDVERGVGVDSLDGKVKKSFFVENISAVLGDSLSFTLRDLEPAQLYILSAVAIDVVGNKLPSAKSFSLLTYSFFAPSFVGDFKIDSLIGGAAYLTWPEAKKDSRNKGGYAEISRYEVSYYDSLFSPERLNSHSFIHRSDTVQSGVLWGVFNDRSYEFSIVAIDSTGKPSDTLEVSSSDFTQESKCPKEAGLVATDSGSFCMQRWEASLKGDRDSVLHSLFFSEVVQNCENYSDEKNLDWSLCTDEEWELSCLQGGGF
ncbi:hypothetical protein OAA91_01045 [Fibrobacterales bacterium]|nr:hypothetical protein [Fibrobacterales bacterium]